ncbi:hypothetical protein, partial [Streptomyces lycii]|uniref:hypothetical protein n=1 Tax=Streptomyces lycii TaxID=2654337 RepID=UPI001C3F76A2
SGVDFWHAVEFSKNGRFLRTRLRALRALPFGVPNLTRRFPFRFRSELLPVARWKAFAFRLIRLYQMLFGRSESAIALLIFRMAPSAFPAAASCG